MATFIVRGILNNHGFVINQKKYSGVINILKNIFTIKNDVNGVETVYELYTDYKDGKFLAFPKHVMSKKYKLDKNVFDRASENYFFEDGEEYYEYIEFVCTKIKYKNITTEWTFHGTMRDYQLNAINAIIETFENYPKGGLLKFSCGMGKTISAIYKAFLLQKKTLIIVDLELLEDQWIERIRSVCNATIGIIRGNVFDIEGKDIVIASVQTLHSRGYTTEDLEGFGLVIYDEVHVFGSKTFSNALKISNFEYTIGLTATPFRVDGMMPFIYNYVGPIIYELKREFDFRTLVKRIKFSTNNKKYKEHTMYNPMKGKHTASDSMMQKMLKDIPERNNLLINIIIGLKNKGRKVFIFCSRVKHAIYLKECVDEDIINNQQQHMYSTKLLIGDSTPIERADAAKNGDLIFASFKLTNKAIDIPRMDTVVYASPVKRDDLMEQSSGRMLRKSKLSELTNIPLVIDIVDELSIYENWGFNRIRYYKKEDWFVNNYKVIDDQLQNCPDNTNIVQHILQNIDDDDFINNNLIKANDKPVEEIIEEIVEEKPKETKKPTVDVSSYLQRYLKK